MSSEKSRAGELTTPIQKEPSVPTTRRLTTAEKQAQQEAEEDRTLLTNYFERIGRRQRIHEAAVYHHLKYRSKDTLALLVSTFDSLYRVEMQTPPSLIREDLAPIDAKAAIARGRALAFTEDPSEAELAWTYNNRISGETLENAWAEANSDANSNAQGAPPRPRRLELRHQWGEPHRFLCGRGQARARPHPEPSPSAPS
ncbi:hypothetical protein C8F04DRAFT_1199091 [Mycena alexandri]|uniref:Uncharacterized protein n=1 Tax=Mycena alexandri TaxID=1745969 RepID=A0AAD6WLB3_9AGAR|nr:hypothetical protein C8F04DRAFT_1199091 [Mycena alexandri]